LPGFEAMNLPPLEEHAKAYEDPYIFHFPDGNASLARLMVRRLIPGVAEGSTMHDVVLADFNYGRLDNPENNVRLRLNSTVLHAKNLTENGKKFVDVVYLHADKLQSVRAKQVIMAGYNMMVPYIVPEMPEEQKKALKENVKAPLVYAKLIIKNWQPFIKLKVHEIYSPAAPYSRVKLDYPVDIGGYKHPRSPDKPICLHMVYTPTLSGSGLSQREQWRKGRAQVLGMSFEQYEDLLREQLHGMFGDAGFNHKEDILAITINRWPHGYSYIANTLFDDEDEAEKIMETARQPIGNITIANSDSHWEPYAHGAIDMAWRAVNELVAMNNERAAS
jgi:spermidine dehydrogenase